MGLASTPSANEYAKELFLIHSVQLKPMIKAQSSGRMVSSKASVRSERSILFSDENQYLPLDRCPHQECVSSLGAHVLTWRTCPQLAYASSTGVRVLTWRIVFVSNRRICLSTSPSPSCVCTQKSCAYHPIFKSIKNLDGDYGVDRCQYAVPFKCISIRFTPEIVLSSKRN